MEKPGKGEARDERFTAGTPVFLKRREMRGGDLGSERTNQFPRREGRVNDGLRNHPLHRPITKIKELSRGSESTNTYANLPTVASQI